MRVRLERRHSHIPERHYLPEHRAKSAAPRQPFDFLVAGPTGMSGVIIEQLTSDEHIKLMDKAVLVLYDEEVPGEILVSPSFVHFVEEAPASSPASAGAAGSGESSRRVRTFSWPIATVREIHKRWHNLNDVAVELFFSTGVTRLLSFGEWQQRAVFLRALVECQPRLSDAPTPESVTRLWQEGAVTNYDYLMQLNKLAGRTFGDLMQYPVFPFVLSDYQSDKLNLNDASAFRNLKKPIAVQHVANEARYVERYRALEGAASDDMSPGAVGPFHFGSHYSNSGTTLHYLVRLPPFTNMFLKYQDGNFDLPDRSFHSVENLWRLASNDSASDVKELTPDLFSLPELLLNLEGLDLGTKQNGEAVGDVVLPPWAAGSARVFIRTHRQALESDLVRRHLCHWIDLVFGCKQTGKEAVEAINVFHPATYYGFDLKTIEVRKRKKSISPAWILLC